MPSGGSIYHSITQRFYRDLCNKDYVANIIAMPNEMEWIRHQFIVDWKVLIDFLQTNPEDCAKFLHILLDRLHKRPADASSVMKQTHADASENMAAGAGAGLITTTPVQQVSD
jgi:hypothetical protein